MDGGVARGGLILDFATFWDGIYHYYTCLFVSRLLKWNKGSGGFYS